jgi:hypothetical protein
MNNKMLTIGAVLATALLAGVFSTTPMAAYADEDYDDDHDDEERDYDKDGSNGGDSSETNTEQSIKQKNVGGDASTNFNCASNDINSGLIDAQVCGTLDLDLGGGGTPLPLPVP